MSFFDEDWILGTKAQSITPFQSITAHRGEGDEAARRESVNNEEFNTSKANQLSTVHEFFNSKQLDVTPCQPHLPAVTLFRICRNHPSIFCISSFCNPFFCQRENSKPRALSPSSVQWEYPINDKTLSPIEHSLQPQKIQKNQPRLQSPEDPKDALDRAPSRQQLSRKPASKPSTTEPPHL